MKATKATVPAKAVGCTIDVGQEAAVEILDQIPVLTVGEASHSLAKYNDGVVIMLGEEARTKMKERRNLNRVGSVLQRPRLC